MKNKIKRISKILFLTFLYTGCSINSDDEFYIDFKDVNTDSIINLDKINRTFKLYNNKDTVYFARKDEEIKRKKLVHYKTLNLISMDSLIQLLKEIPFDSLSPTKEKMLPKIFIVKRDYEAEHIDIIPIKQVYKLSSTVWE